MRCENCGLSLGGEADNSAYVGKKTLCLACWAGEVLLRAPTDVSAMPFYVVNRGNVAEVRL